MEHEYGKIWKINHNTEQISKRSNSGKVPEKRYK